jgi:tRNA(Ile)-lysidine synthase
VADPDGRVKDQILQAVAGAVMDDDCLVALGGGADSAVLLWAAVEALGSERVQSVFVHHDLEGSDALRDSAVSLAQTFGLHCEVIERPVHDGGNLEARARTARYDAIEAAIAQGAVALTGHTADDQAETVLMRIFRGSGTGAASGIPYRRGVWRRPLLLFSRKALREVAIDLSLPFTDDPANSDRRFMRTRIRHAVLPVIEAECGPDAKAQILRSSMLFGADDDLLECEARKIQILSFRGGVSIPIGPLRSLPGPIATRVVRRGLRTALGGYPGSASDVDAVLRTASGGAPVTISDSFLVVREPPYLTVVQQQPPAVVNGFDVGVGEAFTWHGSYYATRRDHAPPPSIGGGRFTLLGEEAVGDEFHVRGFRSGDRIDIGRGTTPVKELLRSAGVPVRVRPYSLIVTVDGKIAALDGVRVASWARPNSGDATIIIERERNTWR